MNLVNEQRCNDNENGFFYYFDSSEELIKAVEKEIKETEVVADIGCGIRPMNYFRPKLHIMVEPWKEYADILSYRYDGDKSTLILQVGALEALKGFASNSVDSIFMLDVIEHIEKNVGFQIVQECERIARQQIVLFTPLGFMPQSVHAGEQDGWGLSGGEMQEHLSGWLPEDFSKEWSFYICKNFHKVDHQDRPLPKPYGAFFAIHNFKEKRLIRPTGMSNLRCPLHSEVALQEAQYQLQNTLAQLQYTQDQLQDTQNHLQETRMLLDKYQNQFLIKILRKAKKIYAASGS